MERIRERESTAVPVWRFCYMCGRALGGLRNAKGNARLICSECGTEFSDRLLGRRSSTLKIFTAEDIAEAPYM